MTQKKGTCLAHYKGASFFAFLALALLLVHEVHAAPTKVGNGDEGGDLEGATPITTGPIVEARAKAVSLLKNLGTDGVPGLGMLLPEVEKAELFMTKADVRPTVDSDQGAFHSDLSGYVYARTFAEPHAATRFFPVTQKLGEQQLITLHIHEALHRALPAEIRTDERVVSALTLAITGPSPTHDRLRAQAADLIPASEQVAETSSDSRVPAAGSSVSSIPETAEIRTPSTLGYGYRAFRESAGRSMFPVKSMHVLKSELFPFGGDQLGLGLGIEASFIGREYGTQAGPLGLSGRMRLWSGRAFDVGLWGQASLNTLSAEELKNSLMGRDVFTFGVSMRKDLAWFYIENALGLSLGGQVGEKIGQVETTYSFGKVFSGSIRSGASLGKLRLGGFLELLLSDYFRVRTHNDLWDSGRYRIFAGGPEVSWVATNFILSVNGRFLLDSTRNANFDYLGNIMANGAAQGSVGASVSYKF